MKDISIINEAKRNPFNLDMARDLYDTLCDWVGDYSKGTYRLGILSESFYTLSSNHYYIKEYILYLKYKHNIDYDLFEPYFKLFSNGYDCYLENNVMIICHR